MRIAVVKIFGVEQRYALHISASPGSAGILDQDIDFWTLRFPSSLM
jgi:hypothetical protein